jgi:hypothetical protein
MADQPAPSIDTFGIGEALALRLFPDHHAFPMRLYYGDGVRFSRADWVSLYGEMMSKPTGVSKEDWHEKCLEK